MPRPFLDGDDVCDALKMAALRAFSLAKISKITIEFSCFDKTVASARFVVGVVIIGICIFVTAIKRYEVAC